MTKRVAFIVILGCFSNLFAQSLPQSILDERLLESIKALDPNAVKTALNNGANPNWKSENGRSVLHDAATYLSYGVKDKKTTEEYANIIFKILFDAGAKFQWCDDTVIFCPIANGCPNILEYLLKNGASATDKMEGMKPIEWACYYNQPQIAEILLKHGASPISEQRANTLYFIYLAGTSDSNGLEKMEVLLKNGVNIDDETPKGETALLHACNYIFLAEKDFLTISFLIDKGADVNKKAKYDNFETSALHVAIRRTAWNFEFKRSGKESRIGNINTRCYFSEMILKKLLDSGAYVSAKDEYDMTPLHIAARTNNIVAAKMLIEKGCKLKDKDRYNKMPLDYAESAEMIALLKEALSKSSP